MPESIIIVEDVGKKYLLNHEREKYTALRDVITSSISNIGKKSTTPARTEEFWALKHVTFSIQQGDRMGIIGRNGAGKSTLLKLLSRITEPTTGTIRMNGHVTSLLEVGTGFHPELSGRENIFLNGAILGMSRADISKRFDEIVAFAEVEQFLDTPVKRYSSGMYVRLAFSVAAHLEPEILIIDEVLAVGDAQFQKKCIGKMSDVSKDGRTIIFVSHNISAIYQLCNKCILLDKGKIVFNGEVKDGIDTYLGMSKNSNRNKDLSHISARKGNGSYRVEWVKVCNGDGEEKSEFFVGDDIYVRYGVKCNNTEVSSLKLSMEIKRADGMPIANMIDSDSGFEVDTVRNQATVCVKLSDTRLYPETYSITLCCIAKDCNDLYDYIEDVANFEIIGGGRLTSRSLPTSSGTVFLTPEWSIEGEERI